VTELEVLARRLCVRAGNTEESCDELVYLTEPARYRSPRGFAYGCNLQDLRPFWMLWLDAAIEVQRLSVEIRLREMDHTVDVGRD
jgi:hypothetical protein